MYIGAVYILLLLLNVIIMRGLLMYKQYARTRIIPATDNIIMFNNVMRTSIVSSLDDVTLV